MEIKNPIRKLVLIKDLTANVVQQDLKAHKYLPYHLTQDSLMGKRRIRSNGNKPMKDKPRKKANSDKIGF